MNIEIRPMQSFIVRLLFMPMFLCPAFVSAQSPEAEKFRLLIVDPGHFHASLVQKSMYPGVDSNVYVFAPDGSDLKMYLDRIEQYNSRTDHPTRWNDVLYTKPDYFEKMIAAPPVDPSHCIMVVSGNNSFKTERIKAAVDRKIHVFADKPCVTTPAKFDLLLEAFESAKKNDVILYDIMTERFEIATILQRELMLLPAVFGELETGTLDNPAVEMVSVHHFCKLISGKPLVRPAWFYDTEQYGEGLVDITTHLVDLVQWACFPEQILDYKTDVAVMKAKRFATPLTPEQFKMSTGLDEYPEYLRKDVKDGVLYPNANGVIHYTLKGVHAKVASLWNFIPPEGTEDTHFSSIRGTKSRLVIRQDETTGYVPRLTIEPTKGIDPVEFESSLKKEFSGVEAKYPGISLKKLDGSWEVEIPQKYRIGHEAHFGQVMQNFLRYVSEGKLPNWEVPNMIAKYYTTTQATVVAEDAKELSETKTGE